MSHHQKRINRQVARSSYVSMHSLFWEGNQMMSCSSLLIPYFLCSDDASLGPTWKDGKKASCRTGQQNGEIPMSGRGKPDAETTLAQEWKRVQKRPAHWGLQGTFAPEQTSVPDWYHCYVGHTALIYSAPELRERKLITQLTIGQNHSLNLYTLNPTPEYPHPDVNVQETSQLWLQIVSCSD